MSVRILLIAALVVALGACTPDSGASAELFAEPTTEAPVAEPVTAAPIAEPPVAVPAEVYYENCAAVRAAGQAPLHVDDPGYRSGLDRDSDGVACE